MYLNRVLYPSPSLTENEHLSYKQTENVTKLLIHHDGRVSGLKLLCWPCHIGPAVTDGQCDRVLRGKARWLPDDCMQVHGKTRLLAFSYLQPTQRAKIKNLYCLVPIFCALTLIQTPNPRSCIGLEIPTRTQHSLLFIISSLNLKLSGVNNLGAIFLLY